MLGDVGTGYGDKERALASGSTLRPTAFPPRLDGKGYIGLANKGEDLICTKIQE